MKTAGVFMVLTLVLLSCFSGVASESSNQIDCSRYQRTKDPRKIACPRIYEPVCGTNGVTYANECVLCEAILNGATIDLAHTGKCKEKIDCSRYQRTKDPRKIACPRIYAPVCGTNGVTYDNECMLCAEILKGATIGLAHKGKCMVKDDCAEYPKPQKGKQFACTMIYRPVCGTNGITYSNKCNLCAARWKTGVNIGIRHEGRCNRKIN
ncbi:ovomucoid-like isoform X1 [Chelonoidis abingdonii]|uniref:ovomucoid-like isoform X1 n=1 Tax=Chelonoidis abingdonii TaxID=106734 RepID=UPI0013F277B2|nr:ovomucoid-like [Chelonoidis abingdonii]